MEFNYLQWIYVSNISEYDFQKYYDLAKYQQKEGHIPQSFQFQEIP